METSSLIHRPCVSTGDYSIWWSLYDGMGRVQLPLYGTPDTSRDDSDRYLSILSDYLHSFMSIVHCDGLRQFQQDTATPHASRVAIKCLQEHSSDFRHFHWPPKSQEMNIIEDIRDALLHAVEKRSPPPRTPVDLLTALQDS
ncbi:hypothetical protein AVEN_199266-1 [Araneus ventricosus]|uniref:Tc1-like transposase DDE domain-containing protein n=1 Tax=Araneus ventricosus TaxID=182803 RepID=A0A4Y2JZI0_ARAVE|nr:hypothetical protein AVEN_199266-1 [Araneus ventricosus]